MKEKNFHRNQPETSSKIEPPSNIIFNVKLHFILCSMTVWVNECESEKWKRKRKKPFPQNLILMFFFPFLLDNNVAWDGLAVLHFSEAKTRALWKMLSLKNIWGSGWLARIYNFFFVFQLFSRISDDIVCIQCSHKSLRVRLLFQCFRFHSSIVIIIILWSKMYKFKTIHTLNPFHLADFLRSSTSNIQHSHSL